MEGMQAAFDLQMAFVDAEDRRDVSNFLKDVSERGPFEQADLDRTMAQALMSAPSGFAITRLSQEQGAQCVRALGELGGAIGPQALRLAAKAGNAKLVGTLIDLGCLVDDPNEQGRTALFDVATAMEDSGETMAILLAAGANANHVAERGLTPLHEAAYAGNTACFEALLKGGANPEAKEQGGLAPVEYAVEHGVVEDWARPARKLLARRAAAAEAASLGGVEVEKKPGMPG